MKIELELDDQFVQTAVGDVVAQLGELAGVVTVDPQKAVAARLRRLAGLGVGAGAGAQETQPEGQEQGTVAVPAKDCGAVDWADLVASVDPVVNKKKREDVPTTWLSTDELSERTGVARSSINNLLRGGLLKHHSHVVGGRRYYTPEAVLLAQDYVRSTTPTDLARLAGDISDSVVRRLHEQGKLKPVLIHCGQPRFAKADAALVQRLVAAENKGKGK